MKPVLPPLRWGIVGGGEGSFIGDVHRAAARLSGSYDLVAAAPSSDAARAARSGAAFGLASSRVYADYRQMAEAEAGRPDGVEAVSIVTPNNLHAPMAAAFLEAGLHVICDKPITTTFEEARQLAEIAARTGRLLAVTYNYTGYPLIRHARDMIANGELGDLRVINAEYAQQWLAEPIERSENKQASWRTDPAQAGGAGALGDIGVHAYNLLRFVSGVAPTEILAQLNAFVSGRQLDDNAHVLLRFAGGRTGSIWASQVAIGAMNGLALRIYGDRGGLEWSQEKPDELRCADRSGAVRILRAGQANLSPEATAFARLPAGHPEGYLEAFANIYAAIALKLRGRTDFAPAFPDIRDGLADMAFIEAALRSSAGGGTWERIG